MYLLEIARGCLEQAFQECVPRENQAGDDTAPIADFAQTWHKFWVW